MKRTWLPLVPLFGLGLSWTLAAGCATDAAPPEDEDSGTPTADAAKDSAPVTDARPPTDSAVRDSAVPDSARPDAADASDARVDAAPVDSGLVANPGEPFDPSAPKPGDMCPAGVPEFDFVSRRCGKCGTQRALCETGRIVGAYGPCTNEKTATNPADICLPNAVEIGVECGLCGSQVRKCDLTCAWSTGVCLGEVVNGCVKNEVSYIEGVCPTIDETRKQTCSPTCNRGAPEACAVQAPDTLVAPQVAAGTVNGVYSLTGIRKLARLNSGACPTTSSTTSSSYHYLRVTNPGAEQVNVTVTMTAPPTGTKPDLMISSYVGLTAIPADATARQTCTGVVRDSPENLTFTIPAGQSAFVLSSGFSATTSGRFTAEVKTNLVGPEPVPAVDYDLTLPAAAGDVSTAVNFVATQTSERVGSTGTNSCPITVSGTISGYRYIRLTNPTATVRNTNLWLASGADTVIAVYPGPMPPVASARTACVGSQNDTCPSGSGITGADSCLPNVSVPANGSIIVYAAMWSSTTGSTSFTARATN